MPNTLQIKRHTTTGAPGSLAFGEMAWSDGDQILYIGTNAGTVLALSSGTTVPLVNDNAGTCTIGMAVYLKSNGHFDLAKADSNLTSTVYGLAMASIATTATGNIRTDGRLSLTTAQWDVITGGSGGLSPGFIYWLDTNTAGHITPACPDSSGQEKTYIGYAESTTVMEISIKQPITA